MSTLNYNCGIAELDLNLLLQDAATNQYVIASTGVAEAYDAGNEADYQHAGTEPSRPGDYLFSISDDLPAGTYKATIELTGVGAIAVDVLYYDGESWHSVSSDAAATKTAAEAVQAKLPAGEANMHAAGAAVAKSPATIDWTSDVSNKPTIGTSTLTEVDVRTAVGLAAANIDTQLAAIQSAADAAGQPMTVNLSGEAITLG